MKFMVQSELCTDYRNQQHIYAEIHNCIYILNTTNTM